MWHPSKVVGRVSQNKLLGPTDRFRTCTINFLMVGHTHEDVDQLFGVVAALLLRKAHFDTPSEVLEYLRTSLESKFRRRGERMHTAHSNTIRCFGEWLAPIGRTCSGAFQTRDSIESPHSFACKLRRDLAGPEAQFPDVRKSSEKNPMPGDVMCCVKAYMRDQRLQQAPVCLLPVGRIAAVASPSPPAFRQVHPLSRPQIANYLTLAQRCSDLGLHQAAAELERLCTQREYVMPPAGWLAMPGSQVILPDVPAGHAYFPHLPARSWRLLVKDR
jgi:hypothetical protein